MGLVSILLGLALFGVLVDVLAENDVFNAIDRPFVLFDHSLHISMPVLAVVSFAVGLVAMLLILAGIRRMRHKSHRQLKSRVTLLENENARLITRENLPNVIPVPETERLAPQQRPSQPPPGAPAEQAPVAAERAEPAPSTEAPKPAAAQVEQAPVAAPAEQPKPAAKPQPAPTAQPAAAQAVPAMAAAKASHPAAAKAQQAPPAGTVVEVPEAEPETPVEPPRQEPVGLPPEQAAQKRAALARTAAAKKIGTPEPEHDDRTKPSAGYEDPPPSTPPEAFLDLQREIAAKTDAEQPPTLKPKPARSRTAKAKPTPAPAPARADAEEPAPAPKDDVVVVPEAEDEEEERLASTAPSDTSVPTTWEWP